jgi:RNase P/RNase MRP subunit p29
MKRGVIDRFEGNIAVIETEGTTIDVPKTSLPINAKTGDSVIIDGDKIWLMSKIQRSVKPR